MRQHYKSRHECTLSEVGTHPDMTLDVTRTKNNNTQTKVSWWCGIGDGICGCIGDSAAVVLMVGTVWLMVIGYNA